MQQPPPNLATTLQQHPSYPPPMPNSQYPPHQPIFHPQHVPPPPAACHPPVPANSRQQPIVHFVPNGLHLPIQRNEQHQNGLLANDGQMIGRQQCQSNLQHQQIRESTYLPQNVLYPTQNQFHHNGAQYMHPNGPIMECSENAGPPPSATTTIPYAQFSGHHHNYLPLPVPAAVPPPNNANGAMMPPIPIPIPPVINMNMNSRITPAAMAAAHAHPPPPPHFPPANPHINPHQFPPPSVSGQNHHPLLANKRAPGPSPAVGPNNAIENSSNNIGIAGPVDCWSTAVTGWEQAAMIKSKIGLIINHRYRILQSIASGSYGEIFAAEDLHSQGPAHQKVAVKFDGACRDNHLRYEYDVYKSVLYEDGNGKVDGFPQVYSWSHEYGHNIMVMELLGPPVASLFTFCRRNFARETIVSLGTQMIQRIRHMHQRGFIHRDIKPENFLMGLEERGRESTLYLIDFGLARRYRYREGENRTLTHIPYRRGRSFIGTAKYASLNSHKNIELSRRDDLESLSYVLIELVNGQLPWKNISKRNATTRHQASQRIKQLKESAIWEEICPSMSRFIRYCREIHFNDEPDYDKLLDLLQLVLIPPAEFSIIFPSTISMRNTGKAKKIFASSTATTVCCQTLETAEKMTQVNLEQQTTNNERAESVQNEDEQNIDNDGEEAKQLANSIQSQLSLNTAENVSDFDEIGAATTTTSCSENELESAGGEKVITTTRSGTGTADDEDSQPTPQQEQQQVSRKCRRHRDQNHQQQQKRVIKEQHHPQNPQQITTQRVKIHAQPRVVDTGLQTDLPQQQIINLPLTLRQQKGGPSAAEQKKMCWQKERETNVERRFQYENKFSWTLPLQTAEPITMGASTSQNHLISGHILNQQAPKAAANLAILPPAAAILPTHPSLATAVHYAGPITNGFIVQAPKQDHHPIQMGMPPLIPSTVMHPPPNLNGKQMPGTTAQFQAVNLRNPPPPSQINGGSINSSYTTSASVSVQKPIHLTSIPPPRPILPETLQQQRGEGGRTLQVAFVLPPPPTHPTMQFN